MAPEQSAEHEICGDGTGVGQSCPDQANCVARNNSRKRKRQDLPMRELRSKRLLEAAALRKPDTSDASADVVQDDLGMSQQDSIELNDPRGDLEGSDMHIQQERQTTTTDEHSGCKSCRADDLATRSKISEKQGQDLIIKGQSKVRGGEEQINQIEKRAEPYMSLVQNTQAESTEMSDIAQLVHKATKEVEENRKMFETQIEGDKDLFGRSQEQTRQSQYSYEEIMSLLERYLSVWVESEKAEKIEKEQLARNEEELREQLRKEREQATQKQRQVRKKIEELIRDIALLKDEIQQNKEMEKGKYSALTAELEELRAGSAKQSKFI